MAFLMLSILYYAKDSVYGTIMNYLLALLFLVFFPALAYPLQPFFPYFKEKGRSGQRQLAIWMSAIGYLLGTIISVLNYTTADLKKIYLIYLFSGILIFILNKIMKINASGHACGIVGPIICLFYSFRWPALIGLLILPITYIVSIELKRHTFRELVLGSLIPVISAGILHFFI